MEKKMENEMETRVIQGLYWEISYFYYVLVGVIQGLYWGYRIFIMFW